VNEPSLLRGLTTTWLGLFVPVGAQFTIAPAPGVKQREAVISPLNSGLASAPAARPLVIVSAFWSVVFCSAIVALTALSVRSSPVLT